MAVLYQLDNADHWEFVHGTTLNASPVPSEPSGHQPIGEYLVPTVLDSHFVAIYCYGTGEPANERYWARVKVKIPSNILLGGAFETILPDFYKTWIGAITVFEFPRFSAQYALSIVIPYWYTQFTISVHRYTGPINDEALLKLDALQSDLTTLQHEFDAFTGM